MHLVCLRVLSKLSARSISIISSRLEILATYCPSDFARHPRSLYIYSKYKATEFCQFLLYTDSVVMYGILDQHIYTHFLFLHAAVRILVSLLSSQNYLDFADLALKKFVDRCKHFYNSTFYSYNVHGLPHFINDVQRFGPFNTFSAFPYENNMTIFRKIESSIHVSIKHNASPLPCISNNYLQYRKITFNNILIVLNIRDNCCILQNLFALLLTYL
ncbi:hypothetical protein ACFW04_013897 [Cataglyphis niger]